MAEGQVTPLLLVLVLLGPVLLVLVLLVLVLLELVLLDLRLLFPPPTPAYHHPTAALSHTDTAVVSDRRPDRPPNIWDPQRPHGASSFQMPHPEVVKRIWAYVKEYGLQDPEDRNSTSSNSNSSLPPPLLVVQES